METGRSFIEHRYGGAFFIGLNEDENYIGWNILFFITLSVAFRYKIIHNEDIPNGKGCKI